MTEADIIAGVIKREGGDKYTNRPNDLGGPTKYGITLETLRRWRIGQVVDAASVAALAEAEAKEIYHHEYIIAPGFDQIDDPRLRVQLIDFGVNSSPARAIRWLQRAIGTPITGVLDESMLRLLSQLCARIVNNALVAARCRMIDDWTDEQQKQKWAEEGLESRALSFFIKD